MQKNPILGLFFHFFGVSGKTRKSGQKSQKWANPTPKLVPKARKRVESDGFVAPKRPYRLDPDLQRPPRIGDFGVRNRAPGATLATKSRTCRQELAPGSPCARQVRKVPRRSRPVADMSAQSCVPDRIWRARSEKFRRCFCNMSLMESDVCSIGALCQNIVANAEDIVNSCAQTSNIIRQMCDMSQHMSHIFSIYAHDFTISFAYL